MITSTPAILSSINRKFVLWLDALKGKTLVSGKVSVWDDQSFLNNDATQTTAASRPTDNTTFLTFSGTNFMQCSNFSSLNITDRLTLYAKFKTTATTNFMGFLDKYVGSTNGYALFLNASKIPQIVGHFQKGGALSLSGTSVLNNGAVNKTHATIECTRKFRNKKYICLGSEPEILKIGSTYHLFLGRYDGANYNIYHRSSDSPFFEGSTETLVIANSIYCSIFLEGSTFNLVTTDISNANFTLYTSTTVNSGYSSQGVILNKGASFAIADPMFTKIGSTYYLYYTDFSGGSTGVISYATGTVKTSLTKIGTAIGNGASGTFDFTLVADPAFSIMPDNTTYCMFYTGYNASISKQQQGYATSTDGITWTKFSGNPVHYFTDPSFEDGVYGPNEPSILFEDGICKMWYRCANVTPANFKIGYTEFQMSDNTTLIAGSETVTTKIYSNNVLEGTDTRSGINGIDYLMQSSQLLYIGGDNSSTLYFNGDLYETIIANDIITTF